MGRDASPKEQVGVGGLAVVPAVGDNTFCAIVPGFRGLRNGMIDGKIDGWAEGSLPWHYGSEQKKKHTINRHLIIHCPRSSGVNKQMEERVAQYFSLDHSWRKKVPMSYKKKSVRYF